MSETFWDTFWGGLASIIVAGIVVAIGTAIWAKVSKVLHRHPDWVVDTDRNGVTHLAYTRRGEVSVSYVGFGFKGMNADPSGVHKHCLSTHVFKKGSSFAVQGPDEWDALTLVWEPFPSYLVQAARPAIDENTTAFSVMNRDFSLAQRFRMFFTAR